MGVILEVALLPNTTKIMEEIDMALYKCPSCGKEISDKALACVHCGYQKLQKYTSQVPFQTKNSMKWYNTTISINGGLFATIVIVAALSLLLSIAPLINKDGKDAATVQPIISTEHHNSVTISTEFVKATESSEQISDETIIEEYSYTETQEQLAFREADMLQTTIEFGVNDHTAFSQFWFDGMYKCGIDFDAGEYYILPLFGAGAGYKISDSPIDVVHTEYRLLKKISVMEGQYVNVGHGAIMVPASDVDTSNWIKYGVFLVGHDIPAGDYKIEILGREYRSELYNIQKYNGEYQISVESPENTPIKCELISEKSQYITLEDGQYIILSNLKLTKI